MIKNKGKKGLRCNRTACEHTEAYYYNRVTKAYYCQPCSFRINESHNHIGGPLCSISDEDRNEWNKERTEIVRKRVQKKYKCLEKYKGRL